MDGVHDLQRLKELQALPLGRKVQITQTRIIEWHQRFNGKVFVSFSGGKDSTVLLHIARQIYPDIKALFSNTGLEYAQIQRFVRTRGNVDFIAPEMRFDNVIRTEGYPLISKDVAQTIYYARKIRGGNAQKDRSQLLGKYEGNIKRKEILDSIEAKTGKRPKSFYDHDKWLPLARDLPIAITHKCCYITKKRPMRDYQTKAGLFPIVGTLAEESLLRKTAWVTHGCNAFEAKHPSSQPLSFWREQDILQYIVENHVEIASVYGEIVSRGEDGNEYPPIGITGDCNPNLCTTLCKRTGCVFCGFGAHHDKESRFLMLKKLEPKKYDFAMSGGEWADNPAYDPTAPKMDGDWQNWNPKKIWMPSKGGLGLAKVFTMVNEIYGKDFIVYE